MTIIADSGSTKTTWVEVESGNKIVTEGLNPHFTTNERFLAVCTAVRDHFQHSTSNIQLYFYGAGCGNATQSKRVKILLQEAFETKNVEVETDMLAACRATAADRAAIVAILGTGSNACLFNGQRIVCQPVSTGYVMGDQGSANHVGRILLNDYLTQRMPEALRRLFHETYPMTDAQLIDAVYHQPHPNRFLASLAPFAVAHGKEDYCTSVLCEVLHDWYFGPLTTLIERCGCRESELNIVGGFAKAIEAPLRCYFADTPLTVGTVLADPIDGLLAYHSK